MTTDLYFDYAAATPLDSDVLETMMPYLRASFYNPSSLYDEAQKVRSDVEQSRKNVAKVLEVKSSEIIFTSGCTEANNLAIHGVMSQYPDAKLLISAIEHDSVRESAAFYNYQEIRTDTKGRIDYSDLEENLKDDVVMISIIMASNEIGVIQDLARIAAIVKKAKNCRTNGLPLYIHTDAAQAANYIAIRPHSFGADLLSLNGSKIYGPKGSGCLYVSSQCKINPLLRGGGQERGLRSGTENVAGIIGFAAALDKAHNMQNDETKRLIPIRNYIIEKCILLGGVINGDLHDRLPNSINVSFEGADNEVVLYELNNKGICIATGSACHAANGTKSYVLNAIGLSDSDAKSSIRITLGRKTTTESAEALIAALTEVLAK